MLFIVALATLADVEQFGVALIMNRANYASRAHYAERTAAAAELRIMSTAHYESHAKPPPRPPRPPRRSVHSRGVTS